METSILEELHLNKWATESQSDKDCSLRGPLRKWGLAPVDRRMRGGDNIKAQPSKMTCMPRHSLTSKLGLQFLTLPMLRFTATFIWISLTIFNIVVGIHFIFIPFVILSVQDVWHRPPTEIMSHSPVILVSYWWF